MYCQLPGSIGIAVFLSATIAAAQEAPTPPTQPAAVPTVPAEPTDDGRAVLQVPANPNTVVGPAPMDPYQVYQARLAWEQEKIAERQARREEQLRIRQEARRSGRPLILSGAVTLGVGYAVSAVVGGMLLSTEQNQAAYMYIPIVGNPIYLGFLLHERHNDAYDEYNDDDGPVDFMLSLALLAPAIAQLTGTVLLTYGLNKHSRYKKEKRNMAFVPTVLPNAGGLSFAMTF